MQLWGLGQSQRTGLASAHLDMAFDLGKGPEQSNSCPTAVPDVGGKGLGGSTGFSFPVIW